MTKRKSTKEAKPVLEEIVETVKVDDSKTKRTNQSGIEFGQRGAPSKAQKKLIERYKINHPNEVVPNTIHELMYEELPYIKEMLTNLENYKDPNVFKVLPKELDDKIRDYHMIVTDYYGRRRKDWANVPMFVVPENYKRCGKCKTYKNTELFFNSYSDCCDGTTHICKDCANELFVKYFKQTKDIKESLIMISQKLDMYVFEPVLKKFVAYYDTEQGKQDFYNRSFLGIYVGEVFINLNLNNLKEEATDFSKTNFGGIPFKLVSRVFDTAPIYNDKFALVGDDEDEIDEEFAVEKNILKLRRRWWVEDVEELKFLEERWRRYEEDYDISNTATESLVMQLCLEELNVMKLRKSGGSGSKDAVNNLRNLIKDSGLSPKSKNVSEGNVSSFKCLSDFITHAETHKPIINKNPKFEDVDNIKKIYENMAGAISQTLLKDNEYVHKLKENFKDHIVDFAEVVDSNPKKATDDEAEG